MVIHTCHAVGLQGADTKELVSLKMKKDNLAPQWMLNNSAGDISLAY